MKGHLYNNDISNSYVPTSQDIVLFKTLKGSVEPWNSYFINSRSNAGRLNVLKQSTENKIIYIVMFIVLNLLLKRRKT